MFSINQNSFLIDYNTIKVGKKLGQGGFGEVYQGTWYGENIAVKQLLDDEDLSKEATEEFIKESETMANLKSPNVIQFFGFCLSPKYAIVMEYMPKGSLYSINKNEGPLPWSTRVRIATDIANGIHFLHDKNILHRDIKSLNVLLDENYKAKLSDFGLAKVKMEIKSHSTAKKTNKDCVGTVQWMAPELFKLKPVYTKKSDIYSLGITFWELATRKLPYIGVDKNVIPTLVLQGEREDIPEGCPEKMAQLIKDCWETNPEKRPDAKDVAARLKEVTLLLVKNEFEVLDKEVKGGSSPSIQWFYNLNFKNYWIGKCSDKAIVCQRKDGALTTPDSINEYKEYVAIKLYALFGVNTPEVVLNKQTLSKKAQTTYKFAFDEHKQTYGKLPSDVPELYEPRLHLMSRYVDGFKDLGENFIDFYQKQSRDDYCKVEGTPLKGFGRALAVATFLYDYDCIGNSGGNMGYVLKGSHAQIVKIDSGEALPFVDDLSKAQGIFHDPRTRDMLIGTGGTKISYLQLNKEDQKEFALTAREILECSDNQLSTVFQEAVSIDNRFEEVLKHLKKRKSKFLDAFSLEVKELLNEQILYCQILLEKLENNNPSTSYIPIDKLQIENKSILFMHKQKLQIVPDLKVSKKDIQVFLDLIVSGQQIKVEEMLKKNKDLILASGTVTDNAKRIFNNITGFQYAIWALDVHMWTMLLNYLTPEAAFDQVKEYKLCSWIDEYGLHSNWQNLLNAQKLYIDNFNNWENTKRNKCLIEQIGGAQLLLPMHVINEYCHPTRAFDPCPDFTKLEKNSAWRKCNVDDGEWFTAKFNDGPLGIGFSAARGKMPWCGSVWDTKHIWSGYGKETVVETVSLISRDHFALSTLFNTRLQQRDELLANLENKLFVKNK